MEEENKDELDDGVRYHRRCRTCKTLKSKTEFIITDDGVFTRSCISCLEKTKKGQELLKAAKAIGGEDGKRECLGDCCQRYYFAYKYIRMCPVCKEHTSCVSLHGETGVTRGCKKGTSE